MFIRVVRPSEDKEFLRNTDHISKIEVEYYVVGPNGEKGSVHVIDGLNDPEAFACTGHSSAVKTLSHGRSQRSGDEGLRRNLQSIKG